MTTKAKPITSGERLWAALESEKPLQIVGVINAYCALLAKQVGFKCLYLSGAGVANASFGVPDLGLTNLTDVLEEVRRITAVTELPLLVDADTGWGSVLSIARTTREMVRAGAAGMHLEDQVQEKRCGHRAGKLLVSPDEMVQRIQAAVDARTDKTFAIMARTDAAAVEGVEAAVDRALRYVDAGADVIFAEALTEIEQYRRFTKAIPVPVLANLTEFGRTPLFNLDEMRGAGVRMVLYPLSAFRAMSAAAQQVYQTIRTQGSQKTMIPRMQTRDELYEHLNYLSYEKKLDELFARNTEL